MSEKAADSLKIFKKYNRFWELMGMNRKDTNWLWKIWDLIALFGISIYYPLHLIIGLLGTRDINEVFNNLVITVACFSCSVKIFLYRFEFQRMDEINKMFEQLDAHILLEEHKQYFHRSVVRPSDRNIKLFTMAYGSCGVFCALMLWLSKEPILLCPGWFPFDWKASKFNHLIASQYQSLGLFVQIVQNLANDLYAPLEFCILGGHLRLLSRRIELIGHHHKENESDHYKELVVSFKDYKCLLKIFYQLQDMVSWNVLLQSVTNGVNFSASVIYLAFYAKEIFQYIFFCCTLLALSFEFYPVCYYGSLVEKNFHDITYSIFSCKWIERNHAFRKSLRIFLEISLRPYTPMAKNMVKIHLDTYFATMRLSYSLFCLVLNIK